MIKVLSPLEMVQRTDVKVNDNVLASGFPGSWVQHATAETGYYFPGSEASVTRTANWPTSAYKPAYIIWSEGNKRGATLGSTPTAGFSPDTGNTKKVTTLFGKWRALTDQVVSSATTQTPGTPLQAVTTGGANQGKLAAMSTTTASGITLYSGFVHAYVRNYYTWFVDAGVTYSGVWEIESA